MNKQGKEADPTAGAIDSHGVKTTESSWISGYDAGMKIKGRRRRIVTATLGLLLFALIHAADIPDRDGAPELIKAVFPPLSWLRHIFRRWRLCRPQAERSVG